MFIQGWRFKSANCYERQFSKDTSIEKLEKEAELRDTKANGIVNDDSSHIYVSSNNSLFKNG